MGEIAALLTAGFWASSSIFFTQSGKLVGSVIVNRMRLLFAVGLLMAAHWISLGEILPFNAGATNWFWLGLSGIVGLVIGDAFLFQAYVDIGPRLTTLMLAAAPVLGTLMAWIMLGEVLNPLKIIAILITICGIGVVVMERGNGAPSAHDRRRYILGILLGLGAALCQAAGLTLSKMGLTNGFSPLSGVSIRMIVAAGALWLVTLLARQGKVTFQRTLSTPGAIKNILLGSIFGPFLGVWMSLIAVQNAYVGVASTLMALTPILVLPVSKWVFKEQVSWQAVIGTLVSMAGIALIFLSP